MYETKGDIAKLDHLMLDIREGRVSRNKNFYTLARAQEYNCFKRAKLLLSLVEDLERTVLVPGNEIGTNRASNHVEVFLYNPVLKYNRRVILSEEELELVRQKTNIDLN
ncbi:MAG: hypothetical protein A2600_10560 [Candidatus Lambdaproteobacteria bacterium RIFOXYD1_FULL_56_27]|uniref:Uncharacterized protein n=1 Tax=Candidatus Lambdaproteobacteria bacterium RIFOXYD2_FULL_56_26 TaxID=1817773 RepID=A0A1F6GZ39_9PROT|nr:MAG: hypothetical protein A2426_01005 [Candidatus Lambdaproteobacteria bacterium RIFOXYC1_FULL_56_13]OGH03433.1 MAG: hypothetical protein A2557_01620 [Candidatus Lambdaproteobacteria bacterium RIFOXYD2_FULL_56_26]OGH08218.1 MAG: hypothetical protein A2600_10560 [Candidatus Lambdaproteobacteria bacterium RIFOXYD1_FULL_56_27]